MRALVISGGGSKGAFAGGIAEYLIREQGKEYDIFVGSSTGGLLVPLLSLGKIDKLKDVYTNLEQKDIFNISPFRIKRIPGGFDVGINHINMIRSFIRNRGSFGESLNLRKKIQDTITYEDYLSIKAVKKQVIVTVSNLTRGRVEYKDLDEHSYKDFCDWMWASANYVPFMSIVQKNGYQYADGSFGNHVPIYGAIRQGATDIDVIVLDTQIADSCLLPTSNPFDSLMRVFGFMTTQIGLKDLIISQLRGEIHALNVKFYFMPEVLTENPLIFSPKQMKIWWQQGLQYSREHEPISYKELLRKY